VFIVFPANTPEGKLFCGGATGVGVEVGVLVLGVFVPADGDFEAVGVGVTGIGVEVGVLVLGVFVPADGDFEAVGVGVTGRESVATDDSCGGL